MFLLLGEGLAQNVEYDNMWQILKYDMGVMVTSVGHTFARPAYWEGDDWITLGGVLGGTAVLSLVDDEVNGYFLDRRNNTPQLIRDFGYRVGSPENNYLATSAVYLTGLFLKDEKLRRTGVLLVSSATAAGALQHISKHVIGRARPRSGHDSDVYHPFTGDNDFHSFPSGHTVLAVTNAHAIAKQFDNKWVKAGVYTVGAIPAFTRILEGAHWLTDVSVSVVGSILIVETIDLYLDRKYDERYSDRSAARVRWDLRLAPGEMALTLNF